jgi:hypothetical protein
MKVLFAIGLTSIVSRCPARAGSGRMALELLNQALDPGKLAPGTIVRRVGQIGNPPN